MGLPSGQRARRGPPHLPVSASPLLLAPTMSLSPPPRQGEADISYRSLPSVLLVPAEALGWLRARLRFSHASGVPAWRVHTSGEGEITVPISVSLFLFSSETEE